MSLLIDLDDVGTDTEAEPILRGFPVASVSDAGSSNVLSQQPSRPAADKETYICTYPGCIRRFETPELLQKHRREGHRQANAPPHADEPEPKETLRHGILPALRSYPTREQESQSAQAQYAL
ncbi:Uu.00g137500.m01.CDS01 [Anthostomella pinea]|uniref:Uu.00g137500.m01.CDS01 n=1 Tax=Anthostomella pinea TaxID=933095 RepID=A0AAI8VQ63_9PEZI|nr:Uu.00g137500.m01.CDS01 [Anthostomella pinea]